MCKKGFVKTGGGEEIRCGSDGQFNWTFGRLSCQPVTCPDPRPQRTNGSRELLSGEVFAISSSLSFSCQEGLELVGEASLTCRPDGNWSSAVPHCKRVKCSWKTELVSLIFMSGGLKWKEDIKKSSVALPCYRNTKNTRQHDVFLFYSFSVIGYD